MYLSYQFYNIQFNNNMYIQAWKELSIEIRQYEIKIYLYSFLKLKQFIH